MKFGGGGGGGSGRNDDDFYDEGNLNKPLIFMKIIFINKHLMMYSIR